MKRFEFVSILIIALLPLAVFAQSGGNDPAPAFKDVISVKSAGSPEISPDGKSIVYTIRQTNWEKNRYESEIWLARDGEEPFQLTRTIDGSSSSPQWSPDGEWIAFLASRDEKQQIYLINPDGGEAQPLTAHKQDINSFEWSPDGKQIVFAATDSLGEDMKKREELYGRFEVEDAEYRMTHLWLINVEAGKTAKARRLTSGRTFTVGSYEWSPDGTKIAFDHRPDPLINSRNHTDISILDPRTGRITPLVTLSGSDSGPVWSPDGRMILFGTRMGETSYYTNSELAVIPSNGGDIKVVTESFDENLGPVVWTDRGVYCIAGQKTERHLFLLDPKTSTVTKIADTPEYIGSISFAHGAAAAAFSSQTGNMLTEIYKTSVNSWQPVKITDMTAQIDDWKIGTREVIEWKSKDGAVIEGILWKPDNFDPSKKYPLLVSIHGGPTGTSRPFLTTGGVYPYYAWLNKGAIILQPNYRGSAGYGEKFRSLNVRNLGVGDAWDVESGVEYLIKQGFVDRDRVGSMGWSQGGYISAFLTTTSDKFKAISVGAGISNWVTYYVNTDIHPFTRQYLKATPWEDMKIYEKTSPMTYINKAQTPTLIQHGEFDQRVPIPNAYELFQGLQDRGITAKLIVYKDFGHGISRPKEQLAAQWHNWQWFAEYIWEEEVTIPLK